MVEKNPTISELIKVIECCSSGTGCGVCIARNTPLCDEWVDKVANLIRHQQKEIERLKDEKEEIRLFNLAIQNGEIDMRIESEMAKSFYYSIIQIFEQNGAKNFFTTTVDIGGKKGRYAFTIEKVGGQTVADKIAELKAEIERLKIDLENERNWGKIQTKQAVKDTAREILQEIGNIWNAHGKWEFRNCLWFKNLCERYGVEVK